jgi:tetratricopeptide (TPR) repeat protein
MLTSDNAELQTLLREGIAAVKQRDYARGRDLLLQVVERDDQIEQAWLWLSAAVDDPQDKMTALENALTINPHNDAARRQLAQLQQTLAPAPASAPDAPTPPPSRGAPPSGEFLLSPASDADRWKQLLPEAPLEAEDNIDDPYQCVYCGRMTAPEHRACPHCGKKLYWRAQHDEEKSEPLKLAILLTGITLGLGLAEAMGPLFALQVARGNDPGFFETALKIFGVEWFLGNFLQFTPGVAQALILVYLVRFGLLLACLFGLIRQWAIGYYAALVTVGLDLLLTLFLGLTRYLGWLGCAANGLLALTILSLLAASYPDFAVNEERLLTRPDTTARGAVDYYKRGQYYRKYGMWALAMAQWRKAVGLAPKEVVYYKDLGIAYAQIRRYARSLRVLEEAQRQAPQDQSIAEIMALVRAQAEKAAP